MMGSSHNHYDHLDWNSILEIERLFKPVFICGLGLGDWFLSIAQIPDKTRVLELDWWQETILPKPQMKLKVQFVPVQHWSKRNAWGDEFKSLWGGFAVTSVASGVKFFFNGDTG